MSDQTRETEDLKGWYDAANKAGLLKSGEMAEYGHALRKAGLVTDPTQGGAVATGAKTPPAKQVAAGVPAEYQKAFTPKDPKYETALQEYIGKRIVNGRGPTFKIWQKVMALPEDKWASAIPKELTPIGRDAILRYAKASKLGRPELAYQPQATLTAAPPPKAATTFQKGLDIFQHMLGYQQGMVNAVIQPFDYKFAPSPIKEDRAEQKRLANLPFYKRAWELVGADPKTMGRPTEQMIAESGTFQNKDQKFVGKLGDFLFTMGGQMEMDPLSWETFGAGAIGKKLAESALMKGVGKVALKGGAVGRAAEYGGRAAIAAPRMLAGTAFGSQMGMSAWNKAKEAYAAKDPEKAVEATLEAIMAGLAFGGMAGHEHGLSRGEEREATRREGYVRQLEAQREGQERSRTFRYRGQAPGEQPIGARRYALTEEGTEPLPLLPREPGAKVRKGTRGRPAPPKPEEAVAPPKPGEPPAKGGVRPRPRGKVPPTAPEAEPVPTTPAEATAPVPEGMSAEQHAAHRLVETISDQMTQGYARSYLLHQQGLRETPPELPMNMTPAQAEAVRKSVDDHLAGKGGEPGAVQVKEPDAGVLRKEGEGAGPGVELPRVGEGDKGPEKPAGKGEVKKEEVAPAVVGDPAMHAKAEVVGKSERQLLDRLLKAKEVLGDAGRAAFKRFRFDFANKRLVSADGKTALQWENLGKTTVGSVRVVDLTKAEKGKRAPKPEAPKAATPEAATPEAAKAEPAAVPTAAAPAAFTPTHNLVTRGESVPVQVLADNGTQPRLLVRRENGQELMVGRSQLQGISEPAAAPKPEAPKAPEKPAAAAAKPAVTKSEEDAQVDLVAANMVKGSKEALEVISRVKEGPEFEAAATTLTNVGARSLWMAQQHPRLMEDPEFRHLVEREQKARARESVPQDKTSTAKAERSAGKTDAGGKGGVRAAGKAADATAPAAKPAKGEKSSTKPARGEKPVLAASKKPLSEQLSDVEKAALARIKARGTTINFLGDPVHGADVMLLGTVKLAQKALTRLEWGREMLADLGEWVRPHLDVIWEHANRWHQDMAGGLIRPDARNLPMKMGPDRFLADASDMYNAKGALKSGFPVITDRTGIGFHRPIRGKKANFRYWKSSGSGYGLLYPNYGNATWATRGKGMASIFRNRILTSDGLGYLVVGSREQARSNEDFLNVSQLEFGDALEAGTLTPENLAAAFAKHEKNMRDSYSDRGLKDPFKGVALKTWEDWMNLAPSLSFETRKEFLSRMMSEKAHKDFGTPSLEDVLGGFIDFHDYPTGTVVGVVQFNPHAADALEGNLLGVPEIPGFPYVHDGIHLGYFPNPISAYELFAPDLAKTPSTHYQISLDRSRPVRAMTEDLMHKAGLTGPVREGGPVEIASRETHREPTDREKLRAQIDAVGNAAFERIKARGTVLGINPFADIEKAAGNFKDGAIVGASYLAHGILDMEEWGRRMVKQFGEEVTPYLTALYHAAVRHHNEELAPKLGLTPIKEGDTLLTGQVARAAANKAREELGLERLPVEQQRTIEEAFDISNRKDMPAAAYTLAKGINNYPRNMSDVESASMAQRISQLKVNLANARDDMESALSRGDKAGARDAKLKHDEWVNEMDTITHAVMVSGQEWHRTGMARQQLVDQYNYIGARRRLQMADVSKPVTPAEEAKLKSLSEEVAVVDGRIAKKQAAKSPEKAAAKAEGASETAEKKPAEAKAPDAKAAETKPAKPREGTHKAAEALPEGFGAKNKLFTRDKFDAARERIRQKLSIPGGGQMNLMANIGELVPDLAEVGGYFIEGGLRAFGEWAARMRADVHEGLDDASLQVVWANVRAGMKEAREAEASAPQPPSTVFADQLGRRLGLEGAKDFLNELSEAHPEALDKMLQGQGLSLAERKGVADLYRKHTPDRKPQTATAALSALGEALSETRQRKAPTEASRVSAAARRLESEIKSLGEQIAKGERTPPKERTVLQNKQLDELRKKRDSLSRQLDREVPKPPRKPVSQERRIAAAERRLTGEIARLDAQIAAQARAKRPDPTKLTSQHLEELRRQREAKQKELDALVPKPGRAPRGPMTPEQRLAARKRAARTSIHDMQAQLAAGVPAGPKQKALPVSDPELDALLKQRAELRHQIDSMIMQRERMHPGQMLIRYLRNMSLLTGLGSIEKIGAAVAVRAGVSTSVEEWMGAGLTRMMPKAVREQAYRERGYRLSDEVAALQSLVSRQTFRDMADKIKTGQHSLDRLYGKPEGRYNRFVDFFTGLHGALKTPAQRAEFGRAVAKRARNMGLAGKDLRDPEVQAQLFAQAYGDSKRAILMSDNVITNAWSNMIRDLERRGAAGKSAATAARILLPIVRVPTNFAGETAQYLLGSVEGTGRLISHLWTKDMSPEQADRMMRAFKKGGVGLGLVYMGWSGVPGVKFGGFYSPGRKDKKGALLPGEIEILGHRLSHAISHSPMLAAIQIGATARRVYDASRKAHNTDNFSPAAFAAGYALATETPFVEAPVRAAGALKGPEPVGKFAGNIAREFVPIAAQEYAAAHDPVKRHPRGFRETVKMGIPGARQTVISEKKYQEMLKERRKESERARGRGGSKSAI